MGLRTWLGLKKTHQPKPKSPAIKRERPNYAIDAGPSAPRLAVFGDFHNFAGATLAHVLSGHWNMVSAQEKDHAWRNADAFIRWAPFSEYEVPDHLRALTPGTIINDTHFNCDKANVHAYARKALGYDSRIDPTAHVGPCVVKSRRNAAHNGRIIMCPIAEVDPGCAYEVLVDNRHGEDEITDLRLVVIMGEMPVAYMKHRPLATRFANANSRVILTTPEAIFSAEELAQCRSFVDLIGLQYGELDILRDRESGRIYIVDANNTPSGPRKLTPEDRVRAFAAQREAIVRTFSAHCHPVLSPA